MEPVEENVELKVAATSLVKKRKRVETEKVFCSKCGRLAKKECPHKYCFSCCSAIDDICEAHAHLRAKHLDNERIFEEVVENSQRKKKPFVHHEEKFDAVNQSVVIFCLKDFYRNKKWNEDVLNAENKAKRQQLLLEKRRGLRA